MTWCSCRMTSLMSFSLLNVSLKINRFQHCTHQTLLSTSYLLLFPGQHEQRQQFIFPEAPGRKDVRSGPAEIFLKSLKKLNIVVIIKLKTNHCLIWGLDSRHLTFSLYALVYHEGYFLANRPSCEIKTLSFPVNFQQALFGNINE